MNGLILALALTSAPFRPELLIEGDGGKQVLLQHSPCQDKETLALLTKEHKDSFSQGVYAIQGENYSVCWTRQDEKIIVIMPGQKAVYFKAEDFRPVQ